MARREAARAIYVAADLFRQRCLLEQKSLLWPDQTAWTAANLELFWNAFIGHPDSGKRSFLEKWRNQLESAPEAVHRVAVDLTALYYLFPSNIKPKSKMKGVLEVASWKLGGRLPASEEAMLRAAFENGVGHPGQWYMQGRPWHVAFYLRLAQRLIEGRADARDFRATAQLADSVVREIPQSSLIARHAFLHLLFPDEFERIASRVHKKAIVDAFQSHAGGASDPDEALRNIRRSLASERGVAAGDLDFYEGGLKELWKDDDEPEDDSSDVPPETTGRKAGRTEGANVAGVAAATHLAPAELEDLRQLLLEKRQVVFEGPPGSGKTFVAERVARWVAGLPLEGPRSPYVELIQFHQSYGYEDFVQGIRPETDAEGRLRYRVRDGIFKLMCDRASSNPDQLHVLVIDEINRGNVARIFGEALLLLEYRDKEVRLPYGGPEQGDGAFLTVPPNLLLIGTMNSTDRSLAQIDFALRRRFYFRRFMPVESGRAPVLDSWLRAAGVGDAARQRLVSLFVALNRRVEEILSRDFQIGHSYFMVRGIETAEAQTRLWDRAIRPLLEEYVHHHRDREEILRSLEPGRLLAEAAPPSQGPQDPA